VRDGFMPITVSRRPSLHYSYGGEFLADEAVPENFLSGFLRRESSELRQQAGYVERYPVELFP